MIKEELEKEAKESWWNDDNCSGALPTEKIYECGYLAGAEPREKRIAELEAQIEKDEDYRKARKESKNEITKVIRAWSAREETLHDAGFQQGAEFGYNKANEWHYVKDGDLPPKTTLVLIKACGCFILGWLDDNDVWHNDSDNGARISNYNVYAWKEIVLPKESKK